MSDCVRQSTVRKAPSFPSASLAGCKEGNFLTSGQAGEQPTPMTGCKTLPGLVGAGADRAPDLLGLKGRPNTTPCLTAAKQYSGAHSGKEAVSQSHQQIPGEIHVR